MRKFYNFILLFLILLIILFNFAIKFQKKNELIHKKEFQKDIKEIVNLVKDNLKKEYIGKKLLIDANKINQVIDNIEVLKYIKKEKINGCFELLENDLRYHNYYCDEFVFDHSISYNPRVLINLIPVRYENGQYIKTSYLDWYDYDNLQFAYGITSEYTFEDNEIIPTEKVENMFVWIPAFYYDENNDIMSYSPLGNNESYYYNKYTTRNNLPFAFFYRNVDAYGIWVQLDNNNISKISDGRAVEIHHISIDEMFVIKLFEKYYDIKGKFSNNVNSNVITVGRGYFFEAKY